MVRGKEMAEKEQDKREQFNEFINKPIDIYNNAYYSYFLSILSGEEIGTELSDATYSLIQAKFINILDELSAIEDEEYKIKSYYELLYSIKINGFLEKNITNLLNSLEKTEDTSLKRNLLDSIVYTIHEAGLMEDFFTAFLHSLDKIGNELLNEFGTLMFCIKGTHILEDNFTAILEVLIKIKNDDVKRSAFFDLSSLIANTPLSEEKFVDLLNWLDNLSVNSKVLAFSDVIGTLKISDLPEDQTQAKFSLIKTKFPEMLNVINEIRDDNDKRYLICDLLFSIRNTIFLEENFIAILNTISTIRDTAHKKSNLSNMLSAIKEEKSFKEKVLLIKERFPEYSDELVKILK